MKLLFILLLCPTLSFAETIICKVVDISDGGTIICLTPDNAQYQIGLYQIDAPEYEQDFGATSQKTLSDILLNKTVEIEIHGKDEHQRTLGTVYYPQIVKSNSNRTVRKDINLTMIQLGMAWYYPFAKKNGGYEKEQAIAKYNKVGLWSQKAIPPWEFRKARKLIK